MIFLLHVYSSSTTKNQTNPYLWCHRKTSCDFNNNYNQNANMLLQWWSWTNQKCTSACSRSRRYHHMPGYLVKLWSVDCWMLKTFQFKISNIRLTLDYYTSFELSRLSILSLILLIINLYLNSLPKLKEMWLKYLFYMLVGFWQDAALIAALKVGKSYSWLKNAFSLRRHCPQQCLWIHVWWDG